MGSSTQASLTLPPRSSSASPSFSALTWIITLSGFPQTLNVPEHPCDWLISHTLSLRYLDLETMETPLLCGCLFLRENWCTPSPNLVWVLLHWTLHFGLYKGFLPKKIFWVVPPTILSNSDAATITWRRHTESSHGIEWFKPSSLVKLSVIQPNLRSNERWRYSDISHSMHIKSIFNSMPAVPLTRRHYLSTQIPENPQQMWCAANSQRGVSGNVTH